MTKMRLDQALVTQKLVASRSQGESWIKLAKVKVNGQTIVKPGYFVSQDAVLELKAPEQFVSRAGLKLASVSEVLRLDFKDKIVLDVGSSTGGFTDFALRRGAKKVIAIDVGTKQLHPSLQGHKQIELHEQTDIRDIDELSAPADVVVIDVSFISLKDILPHVIKITTPATVVVAMLKPQFEAGSEAKHKGVIKNDGLRRKIIKDFEQWAMRYFTILDKADSEVSGAKGNRERFYKLRAVKVKS